MTDRPTYCRVLTDDALFDRAVCTGINREGVGLEYRPVEWGDKHKSWSLGKLIQVFIPQRKIRSMWTYRD